MSVVQSISKVPVTTYTSFGGGDPFWEFVSIKPRMPIHLVKTRGRDKQKFNEVIVDTGAFTCALKVWYGPARQNVVLSNDGKRIWEQFTADTEIAYSEYLGWVDVGSAFGNVERVPVALIPCFLRDDDGRFVRLHLVCVMVLIERPKNQGQTHLQDDIFGLRRILLALNGFLTTPPIKTADTNATYRFTYRAINPYKQLQTNSRDGGWRHEITLLQ